MTATQIAKDAGVSRRQVQRWFNKCQTELEAVPGFDAAVSYLQDLAQPSMQLLREQIAIGNWRVALRVLEGTGLLNPNVGEGAFGAMTDETLMAEVIELAVESKDKTLTARIKRVSIRPGNLRSVDASEDTEALDGVETPEA